MPFLTSGVNTRRVSFVLFLKNGGGGGEGRHIYICLFPNIRKFSSIHKSLKNQLQDGDSSLCSVYKTVGLSLWSETLCGFKHF